MTDIKTNDVQNDPKRTKTRQKPKNKLKRPKTQIIVKNNHKL